MSLRADIARCWETYCRDAAAAARANQIQQIEAEIAELERVLADTQTHLRHLIERKRRLRINLYTQEAFNAPTR